MAVWKFFGWLLCFFYITPLGLYVCEFIHPLLPLPFPQKGQFKKKIGIADISKREEKDVRQEKRKERVPILCEVVTKEKASNRRLAVFSVDSPKGFLC